MRDFIDPFIHIYNEHTSGKHHHLSAEVQSHFDKIQDALVLFINKKYDSESKDSDMDCLLSMPTFNFYHNIFKLDTINSETWNNFAYFVIIHNSTNCLTCKWFSIIRNSSGGSSCSTDNLSCNEDNEHGEKFVFTQVRNCFLVFYYMNKYLTGYYVLVLSRFVIA